MQTDATTPNIVGCKDQQSIVGRIQPIRLYLMDTMCNYARALSQQCWKRCANRSDIVVLMLW